MKVKEYIKSRRGVTLLLALCSIVHIVVLFVYKYETEPVLYAAFLYLVFLVLVGGWDYLQMQKKCRLLQEYDEKSDKNLQELLKEENPVGKEYCAVTAKLQGSCREAENAFLQKERENSDFYTLWVHQIKTPIAALRLLLQTAPENLSGMKGELFKIERYVDIVLNYLRMEDMGGDLLLKHYSLESMVKQAVKKYTPLFLASKLSLKLENLSYTVLTDEKWMVFVLEQLLSNALKYTKKGSIGITAKESMQGGRRVVTLAIRDTGIGICEEDLPRIFERAYTGYNGRDDKKASGLGLYLCKTVLGTLGHTIKVTSTPGEGTEVTITFQEDTFLG